MIDSSRLCRPGFICGTFIEQRTGPHIARGGSFAAIHLRVQSMLRKILRWSSPRSSLRFVLRSTGHQVRLGSDPPELLANIAQFLVGRGPLSAGVVGKKHRPEPVGQARWIGVFRTTKGFAGTPWRSADTECPWFEAASIASVAERDRRNGRLLKRRHLKPRESAQPQGAG